MDQSWDVAHEGAWYGGISFSSDQNKDATDINKSANTLITHTKSIYMLSCEMGNID